MATIKRVTRSRKKRNYTRELCWVFVATLLAMALLVWVANAFSLEGVPEFPFKNTAQTGEVPGWVQTEVGGGTCAGKAIFLLQFTNPDGQLIQIFSDAEAKIVGAWYPDPPYQIPTHLWLGTINAENGKITVGDPVLFDLRTSPTPCVYWEGKVGACTGLLGLGALGGLLGDLLGTSSYAGRLRTSEPSVTSP